jgi:hypothetical protein
MVSPADRPASWKVEEESRLSDLPWCKSLSVREKKEGAEESGANSAVWRVAEGPG